jgi:hypothetical protein
MNIVLSDLKGRLRASGTHPMGKTATREHARRQGSIFDLCSPLSLIHRSVKPLKEAPPLPQDPYLTAKSPKAEMEDFLDNLLA